MNDMLRDFVELIEKGADEIIHLESLVDKLERGKPLKIKLGLDPTAPDIHLGHTVVLRKIRQFQDRGHEAIIIIGDFTGRVGDPTGKSKTRKQLSTEEVLRNAKTYEEQLGAVLDLSKTQIVFNSTWLSELKFEEVLELAGSSTVARMLERDDFKKRYAMNKPIGIHEFFYPLMQAYDSIAINADVEIGGTDQKFNILMGRQLQKHKGMEQQVALFMPILPGTDGIDKMSKSLGNYIGVNEAPETMFGKVMSIPDELIMDYFRLVTDRHPKDIKAMEKDLSIGKIHPRDAKIELALEVCTLYHGLEAGTNAKDHFISTVSNKEVPDDIPVVKISQGDTDIFDILKIANFAKSNSDIRRLIQGGAVQVNGRKIELFEDLIFEEGDIIKAGKRKFCKISFK